MDLTRRYFGRAPSHQNAIDLFSGEWACIFPEEIGAVSGGFAGTFTDDRILWADRRLGGFSGKSVLELGPLEGGHTYAIERLGACSVTSVEVCPRAYLKCLIAKEITGLSRSRVLLGDFLSYLDGCLSSFDVCVACGVLYHMKDPVRMIGLISKACGQLFVWSHYYDERVCFESVDLKAKFGVPYMSIYDGFSCQYIPYVYGDVTESPTFCGGERDGSSWMRLDDILACVKFFGFTVESVECSEHPNGPVVMIAATKARY